MTTNNLHRRDAKERLEHLRKKTQDFHEDLGLIGLLTAKRTLEEMIEEKKFIEKSREKKNLKTLIQEMSTEDYQKILNVFMETLDETDPKDLIHLGHIENLVNKMIEARSQKVRDSSSDFKRPTFKKD